MKKLITLFFLLAVCCQAFSQNRLFVRVYDSNGKKISKGQILFANDTLLRIKNNDNSIDISIKTIGIIRTRRSVGNNILIGSLVGAGATGLAGAATARPGEIAGYTAGEGAEIGIVIGAPVGALVGAFSTAFKNSKTFTIDGDPEKWKAFLLYLSERSK